MMRGSLLVLSAVLLASPLGLASAAPATAASGAPTATSSQTPAPHRPPAGVSHPGGPLQSSPLTSAECKGLGGKVITYPPLKGASGECDSMCVTVDEDNVIHRACINEK